jgi:hypothetical protein
MTGLRRPIAVGECRLLAGSDSSRPPNAAIQSRIFQADPIFIAKNACDASGAQIG